MSEASPQPQFMLCCRCCTARPFAEAKRWHQFTMPGEPTLDVCPHCANVVLRVLRQTPDLLEDAR
jgi:hypothetical protein